MVIGFDPSHSNVNCEVNAPFKILSNLIRFLDKEANSLKQKQANKGKAFGGYKVKRKQEEDDNGAGLEIDRDVSDHGVIREFQREVGRAHRAAHARHGHGHGVARDRLIREIIEVGLRDDRAVFSRDPALAGARRRRRGASGKQDRNGRAEHGK